LLSLISQGWLLVLKVCNAAFTHAGLTTRYRMERL